ncbi:nitroreductase family protein [Acinetobacter silvestris]|uniref:Nitroreductase n=1 Tax=Acinetobacter silvestris TaxID=1977882 RepID=A0A1Y3CGI7_9GAMM|nr:nitroreductase family protein [Acinetobacter silvestris]OTG65022.1 nitroreductase [Acinetobacter silvestris]
MSNNFQSLLENRRTIYSIGKNVKHSTEALTEIIENAIIHSPSSFNSQSSRAVLLFGQEHEAFWKVVFEKLKEFLRDEEAEARTQAKIASFAAGVGTVLFFEDMDVVKMMQDQFPAYADNFPVWSEHSTAMAQLATWTALAEQGVGASLQHYNPIIDDQVHAKWEIPSNWKLRAQLVLGSIEAPAGEKSFIDNAVRFKVFK